MYPGYLVYLVQKIEILYFYVCTLQVFAIRQLKKLKLVFKNAAKVIDPVVILFSADKEISGTQSLCVCWLVLPWISLYLLYLWLCQGVQPQCDCGVCVYL